MIVFQILKYTGVINTVLLAVLLFTGSCQTTASQRIAAKEIKCEGKDAQSGCCWASKFAILGADLKDAKAVIFNAVAGSCERQLAVELNRKVVRDCNLFVQDKTYRNVSECKSDLLKIK